MVSLSNHAEGNRTMRRIKHYLETRLARRHRCTATMAHTASTSPKGHAP